MIETALVMPVFLLLTMGMMDLGIAIFRSTLLSHAARSAVREAIVHGEYADELGIWAATDLGTDPANPLAVSDMTHPMKTKIEQNLSPIDLSTVDVSVQWLDGTNDVDDRVRVRLRHDYQPITFVFGNITIPLTATSTLPIAH